MIKLLLLLVSGVKLGKLFTTGGTMLLSIVTYAFFFGWKYAVGFVVMMFIHEMGHFVAGRRRGLAMGLPTFIPFIGAWTTMQTLPHDAETEAFVGLGGPLLGTAGALLCWFIARNYEIPWLLAVSYSGFMLNLFNLIPMMPFDGGRITAVLSPRIWFVGMPIFGLLFWLSPSPMMLIIALLAAPQLLRAFRYRSDSDEARTYYAVTTRVRIEYGFYYLVLLAFLALMVFQVHESLGSAGGRGSI